MAGQRIQLPPYSMFATTSVYDVRDGIVFGLMRDVIVPDATDQLYVVVPSAVNRLDLISAEFYGVPDLWWVLARVNTLLDPLVGFAVGTQIRVPLKERLASEGILNV